MKSFKCRLFIKILLLVGVITTLMAINFGWHKNVPSITKIFKLEMKEEATVSSNTPSEPRCPTNKIELNSTTIIKVCQPYYSSYKRELAESLKGLHKELKTNANHKERPSKKLLLKLGSIIESLDPRFRQSKKRKEEPSSLPTSNKEMTHRDVCPEVWPDKLDEQKKIGFPFFHTGFAFSNCTNVKPLASVITVLLNVASGFPPEDTPYIGRVVRGINTFYSTINIKIAVSENNLAEVQKLTYKNDRHIEIVKTTSSTKEGKVWNNLVSGVETPYVLMGRNLAHFSWLAKLKRQILVLSENPHLAVVGGSSRNHTGHWRAGCFQTELKNSVLRYTEGYHYSDADCMYCDYVAGPFVARTNVLKEICLDETLNHETVFEDWFLRLANEDKLAMSCPDAMYFAESVPCMQPINFIKHLENLCITGQGQATKTKKAFSAHHHHHHHHHLAKEVAQSKHKLLKTDKVVQQLYTIRHDYQHKEKPKRVDRNTWLNLARKWTLVRVLLPGDIKHSFSCKDIAYQCTTTTAKYYTHPVCCQEQAAQAMDFFHKLCTNNSIHYEMDTGTNLGMVKMNNFMPWELDGDLSIYSSNFSFFTKTETIQAFNKAGHPLQSKNSVKPGPKSHGYINFRTPDFKIESDFWPKLSADFFLPEDIRHIQTLARFHNTWIHSSSSPGLFSRNHYGRGILKHAPHWIYLGMSQSRGYNYGTWLPCPDPGSHRCLDKFPGDGNIPFFVP